MKIHIPNLFFLFIISTFFKKNLSFQTNSKKIKNKKDLNDYQKFPRKNFISTD